MFPTLEFHVSLCLYKMNFSLFAEERLISEYEAMLAHEEDMFLEMVKKSTEVVCPVCQKSALVMENGSNLTSHIVCHKCQIAIPTSKTLQEVGEIIETYVNIHSNACGNEPQFHVLPEDDGVHIYMLCLVCSYMNIII